MKNSNDLNTYCEQCGKKLTEEERFYIGYMCNNCEEESFSDFLDAMSNCNKSSNDLKVEYQDA